MFMSTIPGFHGLLAELMALGRKSRFKVISFLVTVILNDDTRQSTVTVISKISNSSGRI